MIFRLIYVNIIVIKMNIYSLVIIEENTSEKHIICHRFIFIYHWYIIMMLNVHPINKYNRIIKQSWDI